ncbi:hypothetical protein [Holdemanella porci]|uniref:hypothetical protein n=1 Tax=Holdemanella porci TaxID=2652276 RepID=UPI00388DF824
MKRKNVELRNQDAIILLICAFVKIIKEYILPITVIAAILLCTGFGFWCIVFMMLGGQF